MIRGSRVYACVAVASLTLTACSASQEGQIPTPVSPAPAVPATDEWAVCWVSVNGNRAQGNGQGQIGGPFRPPQPGDAPPVVGPVPVPAPPAPPVPVQTDVSNVFW